MSNSGSTHSVEHRSGCLKEVRIVSETGARRRVLFLCVHNSARSQMAEGLLRALGGGRFDVYSAGTVATFVRPEAVAVMRELGIDISDQESKTLDRYLGRTFDEAITVCDRDCEACPYFPTAPRH